MGFSLQLDASSLQVGINILDWAIQASLDQRLSPSFREGRSIGEDLRGLRGFVAWEGDGASGQGLVRRAERRRHLESTQISSRF